jgi:dolichyl-phosphate-mannose-protein mannosyltransferase
MPDDHMHPGCSLDHLRYVVKYPSIAQIVLTAPSENGLVTQSRLILLDSPLVIFTALTALSWTAFTNQHEQGPNKAFKPLWWFWLAATGLCLGATVSVKWVGLFTIAWVGALTLVQLWVLLGDTQTVTPVSFS